MEPFVPNPTDSVIRVGIVGTRRRDTRADFMLLFDKFLEMFDARQVLLISGGCSKGADRFAEVLAIHLVCDFTVDWLLGISQPVRRALIKEHQAQIHIFEAHWHLFGRSAGILRNTKIAEGCSVLLAMPSKDRTGGTEDTINKCLQLNRQVVLI